MTREILTNIFDKIDYCKINILFDLIEANTDIDGFIFHYYNETVLIYNTYNDKYISWYKLTHIGRALNTNINSIDEMENFIEDIMSTIDEENKVCMEEIMSRVIECEVPKHE